MDSNRPEIAYVLGRDVRLASFMNKCAKLRLVKVPGCKLQALVGLD